MNFKIFFLESYSFHRLKRVKPFSLVELFMLLIFISIISTLFIPTLGRARKEAKTSLCINNMRRIGIAIAAYSCQFNNQYPPWISSLNPTFLPSQDLYHCPFDANPPNTKPYQWISHPEQRFQEAYDRPKPKGFIYPQGNKRWNSEVIKVSYFYEFTDSVCSLVNPQDNKLSWNMVKTYSLNHGKNKYTNVPFKNDIDHFPILRCFWHLRYKNVEPVINISPEGNSFYSTLTWEKSTW
jgi:competence protein ComGC